MIIACADAKFQANVKERLLLITLILIAGFFYHPHKARREQMLECRWNTKLLFHAEEVNAGHQSDHYEPGQDPFAAAKALKGVEQDELDYVYACMGANGFEYAALYLACLKEPSFRNYNCYYRRGRWHKAVFYARHWLADWRINTTKTQ